MPAGARGKPERGTVLVTIILFVAMAVAALAAISSSRVISEAEHQKVLEQDARATTWAHAELQRALNVVNSSAYTDGNRNVELRDAIAGLHGGTAGGEPAGSEPCLRDPAGVLHGKVRGTGVRVYRARDYLRRLAVLRGAEPVPVDPEGLSDRYYVLEAVGRAGDTVRLVSALVRENEPFSSFVLFQNRHPLGVSGAPRGVVHANDRVEFHFPDGRYLDAVSAVNGFAYAAGASPANTTLASANPEARPIDLGRIDFAALADAANVFRGSPGLDAEIRLRGDGTARIDQRTPPHRLEVERSCTTEVLVGFEVRTVTETEQVRIGTVLERRTRQVVTGETTKVEFVEVPVYETQAVTRTREEPVYEDREVERTREVPVYERRTGTATRWVRTFVAHDYDDGRTVPGEWVWQPVEYPRERDVIVGFTTETYRTTERVRTRTRLVPYEEEVRVLVDTRQERRTRQVPVTRAETYQVEVPVFEAQQVEVTCELPVRETVTRTWTETLVVPPHSAGTHEVDLARTPGVIWIDGRITSLHGDLRGRVTIVGSEDVRITGNLRYVDADGDPAMLNGGAGAKPYVRNPAYGGSSALGVIARGDILFTDAMPESTEVNGTLLSAGGRVGIDGFRIDDGGRPVFEPCPDAQAGEAAYAAIGRGHARFTKESLRHLGGVISNDRILETYLVPQDDGTSCVAAGFRRGTTRFDTNLLLEAPPGFAEMPRPVVTSIAPVYLVRNEDE